ncbi:MAG: restriction endonuclease subunit S, partial [Nitrospirae bacterium]|nr:restriction endonuclease subunit S [Nitrospirota bacterium]
PERFLEIKIPLPPLSEQKYIVARIEELAAKIEEAKGLRQKAVEEAEALYKSISTYCLSSAQEKYGAETLGSLISMSSGEGLVSSQLSNSFKYPVYGGGGFVGYYSRFLFEEPKIAIGRVGARCGCVFVTAPKSWITDNALYLTKISDRLDPRYLVYALSNSDLRQVANQAAQPVVSQKKINPIEISVPPLPEQRRIFAYLDDLQSKVDALKRLQVETAAELAAMLPSVLDMAFKGEL